jgi:hypothetical protein
MKPSEKYVHLMWICFPFTESSGWKCDVCGLKNRGIGEINLNFYDTDNRLGLPQNSLILPLLTEVLHLCREDIKPYIEKATTIEHVQTLDTYKKGYSYQECTFCTNPAMGVVSYNYSPQTPQLLYKDDNAEYWVMEQTKLIQGLCSEHFKSSVDAEIFIKYIKGENMMDRYA